MGLVLAVCLFLASWYGDVESRPLDLGALSSEAGLRITDGTLELLQLARRDKAGPFPQIAFTFLRCNVDGALIVREPPVLRHFGRHVAIEELSHISVAPILRSGTSVANAAIIGLECPRRAFLEEGGGCATIGQTEFTPVSGTGLPGTANGVQAVAGTLLARYAWDARRSRLDQVVVDGEGGAWVSVGMMDTTSGRSDVSILHVRFMNAGRARSPHTVEEAAEVEELSGLERCAIAGGVASPFAIATKHLERILLWYDAESERWIQHGLAYRGGERAEVRAAVQCSDGTLLVVEKDGGDPRDSATLQIMWSVDRGQSWSGPKTIRMGSGVTPVFLNAALEYQGTVVILTSDGAKGVLETIPLEAIVGGRLTMRRPYLAWVSCACLVLSLVVFCFSRKWKVPQVG